MARSIPLVVSISLAGALGCVAPGELDELEAGLDGVDAALVDLAPEELPDDADANEHDVGTTLEQPPIVPVDVCGDGVITGNEECDGNDLQGLSCEGVGLGPGTLGCDPDECTLIEADCMTPCTAFGQWNICAPGMVQMCDFSNYGSGQDPYQLSWGDCEPVPDCEPDDGSGPDPCDYESGSYSFTECVCGPSRTCVPTDEGNAWADSPPCNTPLVLQFDDGPVSFTPFGAEESAPEPFAAGGEGTCVRTDWPTADTPWLVRDVDGDGAIRGGEELFGSGTILAAGTRARHGFEALGELDANLDGRVDVRDPAFESLALWRDLDGDRRSDPGELSGLDAAGLTELSVAFTRERECDARGNCGYERSVFEHTAGGDGATRTGSIIDVYLPCRDELGPVSSTPIGPPLVRPALP